MSIYKNLEHMKLVACEYAKQHKCNYNIIIHNPVNGEFDMEQSTYEMVTDSYFKTDRPHVKKVCTTDELLEKERENAAQFENPSIPIVNAYDFDIGPTLIPDENSRPIDAVMKKLGKRRYT